MPISMSFSGSTSSIHSSPGATTTPQHRPAQICAKKCPHLAHPLLRSLAASRAAIDEARIKARLEKQQRTPGPGSYDAKLEGGPSRYAGSSAFKSKSMRGKDAVVDGKGDPGAYNPMEGRELASDAARSLNKSAQTGSGAFGSKAKRGTQMVSSDTPGAGSYDPKEPGYDGPKQGSAFASKTKRDSIGAKTVTPGVGTYEPKAVIERTLGGDAAFKSKDDRIMKDKTKEATAAVGPGSYDMSKGSIQAEQEGQGKAAFGSKAKKELHMATGDVPGAGHYNPQLPGDAAPSRPGSAFKSRTVRGKDAVMAHVGDPGQYNPMEGRELASDAARSLNKSAQTGSGAFGSKAKRGTQMVSSDTPGAGSYDPKEPGYDGPKQGSAFASKTKRDSIGAKTVTPGVGTYEPKAVIERTLGGDAAFKSKDDRIMKDKTKEATAAVAPGSYDQSQKTFTKEVNESRGKVSSAFASTSLRTNF